MDAVRVTTVGRTHLTQDGDITLCGLERFSPAPDLPITCKTCKRMEGQTMARAPRIIVCTSGSLSTVPAISWDAHNLSIYSNPVDAPGQTVELRLSHSQVARLVDNLTEALRSMESKGRSVMSDPDYNAVERRPVTSSEDYYKRVEELRGQHDR